MQELQKRNNDKRTATREMIALIVINCSVIQLLPTTLINLRIAAHSAEPFSVVGQLLLATARHDVGKRRLASIGAQKMSAVSSYIIILFIASTLCYGAYKKVNCFEAFTDGAKKGFDIGIKILPTLCAMLVAVSVLQTSGALSALTCFLNPVAKLIGLPAEVLPLLIVRPFSGSAATGVLLGILQAYGRTAGSASPRASSWGQAKRFCIPPDCTMAA